jgi:hypothetical protein
MGNQENEGMIVDSKYWLKGISAYFDALESLNRKYRDALAFAEKRIKSGEGWNQECENVIGEALRPKRPKEQ